jgi:phenylpropionate dioxygenase-like ring-hydroxylating dioxygenase large terminal subunit
VKMCGQPGILMMQPLHTDPTPEGWFQVATSNMLKKGGKPASLHYFAQDLVAFRDHDGLVHVLDAYCPHLGAHLGVLGTIVGNTIQCPFHGWRFDGAGRCQYIPYAQKIPPRAAIFSWPVVERYGMIFVWHSKERSAPTYPLPNLPERDQKPFFRFRTHRK